MKSFLAFVLLVIVVSSTDAYMVRSHNNAAPSATRHVGGPPQYIHIPVMYAVDKTQSGGCGEGDDTKTLHFVAHMCEANEHLYKGQTVTVSLNTPYAAWDADIGDILYSEAHSNGKLLGSNGDANDEYSWNQDYSFTYDTANDIFISVRTGSCSGALSYGITLQFNGTNPKTHLASAKTHERKDSPFVISKQSVLFQSLMESLHGVKYAALDQVFKLQGTGSVETKHCKDYSLAYCFGLDPSYNVSVAVVATDEKSGFGTFVCPYSIWKPYGRCLNSKAISENSGAPFNLVTVDIDEQDKGGAVYARVCGNGRYDAMNNFMISSQGPRHE